MERGDFTRSYLETLSSTDLIDLADEYGIDIPENLMRRFVITEILETVVEYTHEKKPEIKEASTEMEVVEIPVSYNENKITAVLRNPAWCYVYWDFKDDDFFEILDDPSFSSFGIRVSYYDNTETTKAIEIFDIKINSTDRDKFILLSTEMTAFRIELLTHFKSCETQILASSLLVSLPQVCPKITLPSLQQDFSLIQNLSGLPELLRVHYSEYRQSFLRD